MFNNICFIKFLFLKDSNYYYTHSPADFVRLPTDKEIISL